MVVKADKVVVQGRCLVPTRSERYCSQTLSKTGAGGQPLSEMQSLSHKTVHFKDLSHPAQWHHRSSSNFTLSLPLSLALSQTFNSLSPSSLIQIKIPLVLCVVYFPLLHAQVRSASDNFSLFLSHSFCFHLCLIILLTTSLVSRAEDVVLSAVQMEFSSIVRTCTHSGLSDIV